VFWEISEQQSIEKFVQYNYFYYSNEAYAGIMVIDGKECPFGHIVYEMRRMNLPRRSALNLTRNFLIFVLWYPKKPKILGGKYGGREKFRHEGRICRAEFSFYPS
jgi:hypothetical protein